MNRDQIWKNFDLGQELSISGIFIYNGLRRFHEMQTLDYTEDVFEVLYNLSVGIERLLKVAVVLLEHNDKQSQDDFERSLLTHNHLELLRRVRTHAKVVLARPHHEFLQLLGVFYKSYRYDRFTLSSKRIRDKEKHALRGFLEKHLGVTFEAGSSIFPTQNDSRLRKHIGTIVEKVSHELYRVVAERARELNLYTYELRSDSKAKKVFFGKSSFVAEDVLWKELLVFFMNTKASSGFLRFLRSIAPLDFDEGLALDYIQCFQSEEGKLQVMDELETLYDNLEKRGERLEMMDLIGKQSVCFDEPDDEFEEGHDSCREDP